MRKRGTKRVAIVYAYPYAPWLARCLEGVRRFAREQGDWYLLSSPPALRGRGDSQIMASMQGWKGAGIIALIDAERELRSAREMGIPVVNLGSWLAESLGIPRIMVNHFQGGQMAADHLRSRGLRHLAFFGLEEAWYASQRHLGFFERASEAGVSCHSFLRNPRQEAGRNWHQRIAESVRWLASLPLPCGIFALHDFMAQFLMEACQEARLRIPDDIALIGMDNDESICEHLVPPLTSISRNSEQVGWEAAALLDRMMRGEPLAAGDVFVEPEGVVARQSTDKLYCADPVVQRALDYMRAHLKRPFNIDQLAEHLAVSKRTLEMRFRENLQSSPHEFLTRLRVQRALARLQTPSDETVEQTASAAGFGSVQAFRKAFRRITGESLASFRRRLNSDRKV